MILSAEYEGVSVCGAEVLVSNYGADSTTVRRRFSDKTWRFAGVSRVGAARGRYFTSIVAVFAAVCGEFSPDRGEFARDRGGFARDRGEFARDRGEFARDPGMSHVIVASFARDHGMFALDRGEFARDRGGSGIVNRES